MHKCIFCKEIHNEGETNFTRLYPKFKDRILYETENFMLKPALGQISYGHSMIIPKKHYLSIKDSIIDFGINEISIIINVYKNYLRTINKYNNLFIYEHGVNEHGVNTDNLCIEHAHLNLIPLENNKTINIASNTDTASSATIDGIYKKILLNKPYIMYAIDNFYFFQYVKLSEYKSQYFRRLLAKYFMVKDWDWKKYGTQKIFEDFLLSFKDYCGKH